MGKSASILVLDGLLDVIASTNQQNACSAEPLTYYEGVDALPWSAGGVAALGDALRPTTRNGYCYEVTSGGILSGVEPVWPTTPGATVNDNGVVLTCRNNYVLSSIAMAGIDFTKAAGDVSGRKVTMAEKAGVAIHTSGTANHVALVSIDGDVLGLVTTCANKFLTLGDTVTFPAWKDEIAAPA